MAPLTTTKTKVAGSRTVAKGTAAAYDVLVEQYESRSAMTSGTTSAEMIYVLGYANPGDGGDGFYKRVGGNPGWVGGVQQNPPSGQWWELVIPATGLDPRAVGVTFSGASPIPTIDTAAWNSLIRAINSGKVSNLILPPLTSLIDDTLTTITASNWSIRGAAIGGSSIKMVDGATKFGPFFTIGNSNARATDWTIDHLWLENLNYKTSATGAANPLDIQNSAHGLVSFVRAFNTAGFVTLGHSDPIAPTNTNNTEFYGCACTAYAPAGGISVDVQSQAGTKFTACGFAASGGALTGPALASFRGMKIHPEANDTADTMKCVNCEWNYAGGNPKFNFEIDATYTSIGTRIFLGCVFDQAVADTDGVGANIYVHIDAGAAGNAHFDATFIGCTSDASANADCMILDNTGGKTIDISWVGGSLTQVGNDGHLVRVKKGHVDLTVDSARLASRSLGDPDSAILIEDGCSGVKVVNNRSPLEADNNPPNFTPFVGFNHLVKFAGDASDCIITGNDATTCRVGCVDTSKLKATSLSSVIIKDNLELHRRLPFTATTPNTSPMVVQTITLDDEAGYVIRSKIQAQQDNSSSQAYYELIGLFKRDAGGGATQVGATTVVASVATTPAYGASFATNGDNVNVIVTGAANVRWWFATEVDAAGAAFA